ncbi:MAG: hypothetical protein WCA13_16390 [Terriglobales bacterium]
MGVEGRSTKNWYDQVIVATSSISPESAVNHTHTHSTWHIAVWLFAALQFFYLFTSTGRVRTPDEYNTLYTTESLVLRGSTAVPQAVQLHNFYGRYDLDGQPRAAYPPGQALLCAPWYAFGQYVLPRLPGVPASDTDLVVAFSSCLSSATFSALTVMFFFLLLVGIGIPAHASLFAAAMVGLGTPIFAYSAWLFSEPISSAVFVGVALLLFGRGNKNDAIPLRTASIAGLILGLTTIVRPTNVLAIPVFAVAVLVRDGKPALRAAFLLCAASAIGVAALLSYNALLFGGPFRFGYPAAAEGAKPLNTFDTPLLKGLYGFLLSPGKSVFVFAPPVILALAGLRRLWKLERGAAVVAVLLPLTYLFFFARYTQWEGGYCVGPRYMVPSIMLLCLALGPMLADGTARIKNIARTLLGLGAFVQCVSIATSFMEDQVPRGCYYDANWTYRLSYSLSGPLHLLWKYLGSAEPARLGLGWDRWFVFLHKGGVSAATLAVLGLIMLAGLAISLAGLARSVRSAA